MEFGFCQPYMQHFGAGALVQFFIYLFFVLLATLFLSETTLLPLPKCTRVFLMTLAVKGSIHGLQLVLHHPGIEKALCSLESRFLILLGISVWSHRGPVATLRFFYCISSHSENQY